MKNQGQHLEELKAQVASGKRPRYLFFWGHTPKGDGSVGAECFSQWYGAPFEDGGLRYPTSEHYMMAEKARLFGDEVRLEGILRAGSPGAAKALGREVRGFSEDVWRKERFGVVLRANVAKFSQNSELRTFLVGTRARVLVEASPHDRIWGIGLDANDARAKNPLQWRGMNLLGFALMEVRDRLGGERSS